MLPEPETTSRSTGPDTCNVRSIVPVSDAHKGSAPKAVKSRIALRSLRDFIFVTPDISYPEYLMVEPSIPRGPETRSPDHARSRRLLENHLLSFFQAGQQFRLRSIGDAHDHRNFLLAVSCRWIGYLDGSFAVLVIDQRTFRYHQYSLMFFQKNLCIRRHHRFEFTFGVVNRDPHLKGGYVVLLHAHGRNFGDLAVKDTVFV